MHQPAPLSPAAQNLKTGIYQHFKGGKYKVLGVGRLSEDRETEMVIYQSLDNNQTWLRPLEMFMEEIERGDYKGPRFRFIE